MNEMEYILRIVLRARDELAAGLAKARTQIRGFKNDIEGMDKATANLNKTLHDFDGNMANITKKLDAWRSTLRGIDKDGKDLAKTFDGVGKAAEASARKTVQVARTQEQLQKQARALRDEVRELHKARQQEAVDADFAATKYKSLAKQLQEVSLRMSDAARTKSPAHYWAQEATEAAEQIKDVNKEIESDLRDHEARKRKVKQDALAQEKRTAREVVSFWQELHKELVKDEEAHAAAVSKIHQDEADQAVRIEQARHQREAEIRRTADAADRRLAEAKRKREEENAARQVELARMQGRLAAITERARAGRRTADDATELRQLAKDYDRLAQSVKHNHEEFRRWAGQAQRIRTYLTALGHDADRNTSRFGRFSAALRGSGDNIATLDNRLRGIILLGVAAFLEQLITAVAGLGGELVALAGSAAQAGGALGGILAAGAAQALPVIGLLAGAVSRVNSVMEAFQQNQKLQQAQATDAEKGQQKAIDQANALASAHDQVASANERLTEARKDLTKAQKDGQEQLEDLTLAEKEAALAARGAALNVKDAQEALRQAVAGGASATEVQQRQLAVEEAKLAATKAGRDARRARGERAAAGGDIGNLEGVQNAAKAVKDAERAAASAGRGLEQAEDKANRAAGSTMTAAANLNYLLSQMSPAERKLYTALNRIYKDYQKIFIGDRKKSGIYGTIISSFADAVNRVDQIMKMPRVRRTLQSLSNEIGRQIRKVTSALTSEGELDQLMQITKDARENLGPITDMAIKLADAFTNIAVTANPAFQALLEYLGPIVDKFLALTEDSDKMEDFFSTGEEHLEAWLDLLGAIGGLFAALFGASADTGKKSVEDLTKTIKDWTDWIESHRDRVQKFFEDAYKVVKLIGGVLEELAVQLAETFNPEHLEKFAKFFEDTLLPAVFGFIRTVGDLTDIVLTFVNTGIGSFITKAGIFLVLFGVMSSSILGVVGNIKKMIGIFGSAVTALGKLGGAADEVGDALGGLGDEDEDDDGRKRKRKRKVRPRAAPRAPTPPPPTPAPGGGAPKAGGLGGLLRGFGGGAAAGAGGAAGAAAAPAAAGAAVPLGIAAAVLLAVAAVGLLLDHFGKLDDVWKGIKDTANEFMEDIEPAVKTLQDALDDLGIHFGSLEDVIDGVWKVLEGLAEFISVYLIETIKGLGKVIGGVVTGLIYIISGVINLIHGVVDVLIGFGRIIVGIFTLDWDQIKKGLNQILDGLEEMVKGAIQILGGIIIGIIKIFEGLWKLFLTPFKAAWAAVKKWFGIDSPSKKAIELAEAIIDGIKEGLKALGRALTWPFRKAWGLIKDIFGAEKVEKFGKDVIGFLADGFRKGVDVVKKGATWVWGRVKEAFGKALEFGKNIAGAIVDGLKTLPDLLKDAVEAVGSKFIDVGKKIGGKIVEGVKSVVSFINPFDDDDDKKKKPAPKQQPTQRQNATRANVDQAVIPFGAKDLETAQTMWSEFWKQMRASAKSGTDAIQREFRQMRISTTQSADRMYRDIRASIADIQNSFRTRSTSILNNWTDKWYNIDKVAHDGLSYIARETNKALKGLDEKQVSFGLAAPKKADDGKAAGGFIGRMGQRGRDRGFYALGAGEAVLNWMHQRVVEPAMNAFYGFGLNEMFGRTRGHHAGGPGQGGFAAGGIVPIPGFPGESIHSSILGDVLKLVKQYKLTIYDGLGGSPPHAANSDHKWGGAIDAGPGPGGSWDLVDKLAAWAEPTQGNPRSPFRWVGYNGDPNHGRGNHIHLSWIKGKTLGAVGDIVTTIMRRIVTGDDGSLKTIIQSALDKTRKVANKFLDSKATIPVTEGYEGKKVKGVLTEAQVQSTIRKALNILDITTSVALWVKALTRQAHRESGFDPNAVNNWDINAQRGDPSKGLIQTIGATFSRFKFPGHDNIFNPLDNVLAAIRYIIATYGGGDADRGAQVIWGRGGGAYREGGVVPGGDGQPRHIMAHAGEWVLNKIQQSRVANMLGLSRGGLGSMLGFYGGPFGFAGGGEVKKRITKIVKGAEGLLGTDEFVDVEETLKDLAVIMRKVRNLGKITKKVKPVAEVLDVATREGGLLDQLRSGIERRVAQASLKLRQRTLAVVGGTRRAPRVGEQLSGEALAGEELKLAQEQRADLLTEQRQIARELEAAQRRLKRKKLSRTQRNLIQAQVNNLQTRMDESQDAVQQNVEDIFAAQEAVTAAAAEALQKRIDEQTKLVDDIRSRFARRTAANEIFRRMASALGNADWLRSINAEQSNILTQQANELEGRIAAARGAGANELADQLEQDVADLRAQVFELAQQAIKDAVDAINNAATRRLGHLDLFQRMADVVGTIGGAVGFSPLVSGLIGQGPLNRQGILQQRGAALSQQYGGLVGQLGAAQTAGNVGLVAELTDQLAELEVAMAENTKAQRDLKESQAAEAFDYNTSIIDLKTQLLDATDAVTGQTSTAEKLALVQEKQALLVARGNELQQFLNDAKARGDDKAVQDLTKQLLENQIATVNNTKAINEVTGQGQAPQSFSSPMWQWFRTALFGGTGNILPQYQLPSSSMAFTSGNTSTATTSNGGNTYNTTIEVNEAGGPVDPTQIGSAVVFAQSTASN